jgi:hypothetical protein
MNWALWRNELREELPYVIGAALLTGLVLVIAFRRWRRHRLASALLIVAVVTLFGSYIAICFPETVERLLAEACRRMSVSLPHTPPDRVAEVCRSSAIAACGVALFALARSLRYDWPLRSWARSKRVGDYDGPRLDQAFDEAASRLPHLWEQLSGLPEFELGGRRRLRPLAFAKFLQRSVQAGRSGTQNVRFDIVAWEDVANERVRQALLDAPIVADEVEEPNPPPPRVRPRHLHEVDDAILSCAGWVLPSTCTDPGRRR